MKIYETSFKFYNNPAKKELCGSDFNVLLDNLDTTHGTVSRGFTNDGPSVNPYPLRLFVQPREFPLTGDWHDGACLGILTPSNNTNIKYSRFTADAFLYDAFIREGLMRITSELDPLRDELNIREWNRLFRKKYKRVMRKALAAWLGVQIGARTGYKTVIPEHIKEAAVEEFAYHIDKKPSECFFDDPTQTVKLK